MTGPPFLRDKMSGSEASDRSFKSNSPAPPRRTSHSREMQPRELPSHDLPELSRRFDDLDLDTVLVAGDDDRDEFVGTTLGHQFLISRLIRRDNHANVYSVVHQDPLSPYGEGLEARAYYLNGPTKLRQYKQRNMARLSSRKIFAAEIAGHTFVVYTTEQPALETAPKLHADKPPLLTPFNRLLNNVALSNDPEAQAKREKARLKQRERRIRKRREKKAAVDCTFRNNDVVRVETSNVAKGKPSPDDRNMAFFRALDALDQPQVGPSENPTPGSREISALGRYFTASSTMSIEFGSICELEFFAELKKKEVAEIIKHKKKLFNLHDKKNDELFHVVSNLYRLDPESWDYQLFKITGRAVTEDIKILRRCLKLIPKILEVASSVCFLAESQLHTAEEKWKVLSQSGFPREAKPRELLERLEQLEVILPETTTSREFSAAMLKGVEGLQRQRPEKGAREGAFEEYIATLTLNLGDVV